MNLIAHFFDFVFSLVAMAFAIVVTAGIIWVASRLYKG